MKKLLLIVIILCIIACVLSLLFALLNMHTYYNLYDGSTEYYARLHNRMIISFVVSGILAVIGIICIIVRSKI